VGCIIVRNGYTETANFDCVPVKSKERKIHSSVHVVVLKGGEGGYEVGLKMRLTREKRHSPEAGSEGRPSADLCDGMAARRGREE